MNFFDQKDVGNHPLKLCPKVVKHPVYNRLVQSPENIRINYYYYLTANGFSPNGRGTTIRQQTKADLLKDLICMHPKIGEVRPQIYEMLRTTSD
jgi:hypothetical protein